MRALWSVLILTGILCVHGCSGLSRVYEETDLPDEEVVIIKCRLLSYCYVGPNRNNQFTEARLLPGNRTITAKKAIGAPMMLTGSLISHIIYGSVLGLVSSAILRKSN